MRSWPRRRCLRRRAAGIWVTRPGEICDLRRIILHMIEETARHVGHLDIARELTDNRTGLGQRYSSATRNTGQP